MLSLIPLFQKLQNSAEKGIFMPILDTLPKIELRMKNLVKACGLPSLNPATTQTTTPEKCKSSIKNMMNTISPVFSKPTTVESLKTTFREVYSQFPSLQSICVNMSHDDTQKKTHLHENEAKSSDSEKPIK